MIASSNKDKDLIWKYVKQTRADYLWNISQLFYSRCSSFINEKDITNNFNSLAQMLDAPNTTEKVLDMDLDTLDEGAKMFLFLNSCPSSFSLKLQEIFKSSDAYTVIMSTMKLLKSSSGSMLETMIKTFNSVSNEYGNTYSKLSYEPNMKKLELSKNLTVLNGKVYKVKTLVYDLN